MHKNMIFISILLFTLLISQALAKDCERSITFTQVTKEVVCDATPFTIRLDNKNGWEGYEEVIFAPSDGINFNTFPHVMLEPEKRTIDMSILCIGIEKGYIDANILGKNNSCSIRLELESLFEPVKNDRGEIVVTDVSTLKKNNKVDYIGMILTAIFIISAIIIIRSIKKKKRRNK